MECVRVDSSDNGHCFFCVSVYKLTTFQSYLDNKASAVFLLAPFTCAAIITSITLFTSGSKSMNK